MSYMRVIPRDLFNEANLLKCLAQLYLASETLPEGKLTVELVGPQNARFLVEQDPSDGSLYVANVRVCLDGMAVTVTRPLNARNPWPVYATYGDVVEQVFDDAGAVRNEFLNMLSGDRE